MMSTKPTAEQLRRCAASPTAFILDLAIPTSSGVRRLADVAAPFQRELLAMLEPSLLGLAQGRTPPVGRFFAELTKGSGKTQIAGAAIAWLLAFSPRALMIRCGAVDAEQASECRRVVRELLRHNQWLTSLIECDNWRLSNERTGSECLILSSDSASTHGGRPNITFIDEVAHIPEGKESFIETLLDDATKLADSVVIVTTNSGFIETLAWKLRNLAMESPHWCYFRLAEPAPWIDREQLSDLAKVTPPSRHNRLWWGTWSSETENPALTQADISRCLTAEEPLTYRSRDFDFYVAGADFAVRRDRTGVVVVGVNAAEQRYRVCCCRSWKASPGEQICVADVRRELVRLVNRYELLAVCFDPSGAGDAILQDVVRETNVQAVAMAFTPGNLDLMCRTLMQTFSDGRIALFPDETLLADLRRLQVAERIGGYKLTAVRDQSGHADVAVALSIALPFCVVWAREFLEQRYVPCEEFVYT